MLQAVVWQAWQKKQERETGGGKGAFKPIQAGVMGGAAAQKCLGRRTFERFDETKANRVPVIRGERKGLGARCS